MKRPLLLALLAGTALAVPLAQAQLNSAMTLALVPPNMPLYAGGRLVLEGTMTYTADNTALLNTNGIPLTYAVTNAPAWATVTVSPQTDVIPVYPGLASPSFTVSRVFTIIVDGASHGADGEVAAIEITATANPTAPASKSATARATTPVRYELGPDEACEEHGIEHVAYAYITPDAPAPATEAEAPDASDAPEDGTTTTVQSGSTTPIALPAAAVLGFGAVGAVVGLLLRRRAR
jgi:hypothetical protein